MTPEELKYQSMMRDLYYGLAKCIAGTDPKYRAELCQAFRINPKDVEASTVPSQEGKTL